MCYFTNSEQNSPEVINTIYLVQDLAEFLESIKSIVSSIIHSHNTRKSLESSTLVDLVC